jgi:hypothetical protein
MPEHSTPQKQRASSKQKPEVEPDTKKPNTNKPTDAKSKQNTKLKENLGQGAQFDFWR